MAVVETERHGQVLVVRMNRPERLNALSHEMRTRLAETWTEFRRDNELEVAIFTGAGRIWRIMWTVLTREAGGRVNRCSAIATAVGISSSGSTTRFRNPIS